MRRMTAVSSTLPFHRVTRFCRHASKGLGLALLLAAAASLAKDAPALEEKPTANKGKVSQDHADPLAMPVCLEKLKLTSQQQDEIKEIVRNYDASISTVWNQFGNRYMQAIAMESSLLAAIEDNLTEAQRQQVRDQRRKMAKHEKAVAATSSKVNQADTAPNESTKKPANAAEEGLATIEVSLTDEQEAAADKVQEKYRSQLRSLNRDIQGMHSRLVSLEADKLVEIEKVLTKEQLTQLRTSRQNAPATPKVVTRTDSARTIE